MNGHTVTVTGAPGAHWGTCECGEKSDQMHFQWQIDDWRIDHHADVTRRRLRKPGPRIPKPPDEDQQDSLF